MTANQINYYKAQEERRHNVVSESIESRKAGASELSAQGAVTRGEASKQQAAELLRHNQQQEAINWFQAEREAQLKSAQSSAVLEQAAASTRQSEASLLQANVAAQNANIRASELGEAIRHNLQYENETRRHNLMSEDLRNYEIGVQSAKNVREMDLRAQELAPKLTTADASAKQAEAAAKNATTNRIGVIGKIITDSASVASKLIPYKFR